MLVLRQDSELLPVNFLYLTFRTKLWVSKSKLDISTNSPFFESGGQQMTRSLMHFPRQPEPPSRLACPSYLRSTVERLISLWQQSLARCWSRPNFLALTRNSGHAQRQYLELGPMISRISLLDQQYRLLLISLSPWHTYLIWIHILKMERFPGLFSFFFEFIV